MSDTDCPECWKSETPWQTQVIATVMEWVLYKPNAINVAGASFSAALRITLGGRELTWYEKHRERFIKTGDLVELARMNRHVTIREEVK